MDTLLKIGIIGDFDIKNTSHPGKHTEASTPLIDKLSSSLVGVTQMLCIVLDSMASLFLSQLSSQPGRPHPLIRSFIEATARLKPCF